MFVVYSKIIGTGSYFPERILTNYDLEKMVKTSDEWILTRTGISRRHIAAKDESVSDLAYKASAQAFDMAGVSPDELDGIIFASTCHDYAFPSSAALLQNKIGTSGQFAFDMNCACSGFIYALGVADSFIRAGMAKKLLIASAEKLSAMVDWTDRNTCILFGDGAACTILAASDDPGIRSVCLEADGAYGNLLNMPGSGANYLTYRDSMDIEKNLIHMKGSETFKIAVKSMADISEKAVEKAGLSLSDINKLVPHQANMRIIEATAKRLELDLSKVVINLNRRGNTSAASVPSALDEGLRQGQLSKGDNVVLAAFGGGMAWGAAVVTI